MKNSSKVSALSACSIAVLLSACGGSGSAGLSDNSQPEVGSAALSTSDLNAPVMFDWSSDKKVTLSLALHNANGQAAAKTRVSVYEMPQAAALDKNREPTDAELEQVAEIFTGYTDNNGRVSTTVSVSAHALATQNVYVKTKLIGVSATAVVPIDETSLEGPQAAWTFGPPSIATDMPSDINPSELGGEFMLDMYTRSAGSASYFLEPFNQNYHWYYGHLPRAQRGDTCDVGQDEAGTQCQAEILATDLEQLASIIQEGSAPAENYLNANQESRSLVFNKKAKVAVSFLQESAGNSNTFGFFKYNSEAVPTNPDLLDSATIVFPNTSYQGSGGFMRAGDAVSLGEIDPSTGNDAMGFYLAANGWLHNRGQGQAGQHFYSLDALNPEEDKDDAKHVLFIAKDEVDAQTNTRRVWLAFEDLRLDTGSSDRDYNDLIIQVDVYPADALVNAASMASLDDGENNTSDADNDGVLAADDVNDNDADRAFVRYYPAEKGWATLLAEDNWPVLGDFDMNDMVVRYKVKEVLDSQNRIKDISVNYILEARGAAFHNGFAVAFGDNVFADNVQSAMLNNEPVAPMTDPTVLAYEIFGDAWDYASRGENGCWTFNTVSSCENRDATEFTLALTFNNAVEQTNLQKPPYNPFLVAHKTEEGTPGYTRFDSNNNVLYTANGEVKDFEIHMPNKVPTQGQDVSMFGMGDDASNGVDRYYVSKNNLPWVLNIPYQIYYPEEYTDISTAYPQFPEWVSSGGTQNRDWYLEPAEQFYIYDASNVTEESDADAQTDAEGNSETETNTGTTLSLPTGDNLSLMAKSDGRSLKSGSSFKHVHDGSMESIWVPQYNGGRVSLKWTPHGESMNTVVIREAAGFEGGVRDWRLVDNKTGYELARGTGLNNVAPGVGLIEFETRTIKKLNFIVDNTNGDFAIAEFETYLD